MSETARKTVPVSFLMVPFDMLVIAPCAIMWKAFALTKIWSWMIVPYFHASPITMMGAIGISWVYGLVSMRYRKIKDGEYEEEYLATAIFNFLCPALSLCLGYLIKLCADAGWLS